MKTRAWFSSVARETRGSRGRLAFFVACLAVGVAAVVAVAGLSSSLEEGIRVHARELLAADIALSSRRPLPDELDALLDVPIVSGRTDVRELATLAAAPPRDGVPGPSQLVELKVVDGEYPFYGTLTLQPDAPLADLLGADGVVCAPPLLARLGLGVGDELRLGGQPFTVRASLVAEPDRLDFSLTMGPRVFVSLAGLERTTLTGYGSRVRYRALLRLAGGTSIDALDAFASELRKDLPSDVGLRVETYAQAQPSLRRSIDRVDSYLGLVALLSLLVGGIGVAQTVRAWLAGRMEAIATLKCIGMRPREALGLYMAQTLLLGLAGSVAGVAIGVAVQAIVPTLAADVLPPDMIRTWQPAAALRGLLLGLGVALIFSLPPLLSILRVPPALVIRRDAAVLAGPRGARGALFVVLLAGVFGTAWLQAGSWVLAAQFTGGVTAVVALLALTTRSVIWVVGRLRRERLSVGLAHGLAALARPEAGTMGGVIALGLGVLVVAAMSLVQARLGAELEGALPADAPSSFLVDVQPDQWPDVERLMRDSGASEVDSVPVVMARLSAIGDVPVEELVENRGVDTREADLRRDVGTDGQESREDGDRSRRRTRWVLTREQRLTWLDELPDGNVVVDGELWGDPERAEVSLEQGYAEDLRVGVGDVLTFDVQGVPIELVVGSIRTVDWRSFRINFFLVVEPGVLEEAPHTRIAAARLPDGGEAGVQDALAAEFPNITVIGVREILEKLRQALLRIGMGVRVLGGFTVLAGLAILAGAISAGSLRRGAQVALLKTLGVTRGGVARMFCVEYALVGLVAGVIGTAGGAVLAWAVLTRGMELEYTVPVLLPLLVAGAGVALAVLAGLAASARALTVRPIAMLRGTMLLASLLIVGCSPSEQDARGDATDDPAGNQLEIEILPVERGGQELVGTPMPPLEFDRWVRGAPHDNARATLYRWWTDTCPFCSASLPAIEAMRERYESAGVDFVAVYHPKPPREVSDEKVLADATRLGWNGTVALDTDWSVLDSFYLSTGRRAATSVSFLVDDEGIIRFVHPGPEFFPSDDPDEAQQDHDHELVRSAVVKLIGEASAVDH